MRKEKNGVMKKMKGRMEKRKDGWMIEGKKVEEWKGGGNMEGRMDEKMGTKDIKNDGRKKNVKK